MPFSDLVVRHAGQLGKGDKSGALTAYKAALPVVRRLARHDPDNTARQTDLVAALYRVASASAGAERDNCLREALVILDKLQSDRKLAAAQRRWPALIRASGGRR